MSGVLSFLARSSLRSAQTSAGEVRSAVLGHLQQMCRTRQGSCPTAPMYGLPDLTDVMRSPSEMVELVARALAYTIDTYEPRLRGVRVQHIPGEGWDQQLRFSITAQLVTNSSGGALVKFATRIDPSRRVMVE